jgi:gluconate 2-dehydrogenase alpha chain
VIVHDRTDVCVVGLGAAGGVIAGGLVRLGLRVVALEAGPDIDPRTTELRFTDDEVAHIVDRALLWSEPEVMVFDDGPERVGCWLARNIGVGGPHVWSGFAYRFHPSDFRPATGAGIPAGTSVCDWPLTYGDLEPWYERAERLMDVAGAAGENPFEAPRRRPYPRPPRAGSTASRLLFEAARARGWHPYRPPAAILARDAGLRRACNHCGHCTFYGCHRNSKFSTLVTVLHEARASRLLSVRSGCVVTQVACDHAGRPRSVRYVDPTGDAHDQPARVIVLALNAPYVARMLLLSRSEAHPTGLGNASDQVGRHLTFHTGAFAYGLYDEPVHSDRGPAQHVGIDDFNESRPADAGATFQRGGIIHGGMPAAFTGGPLAFARALDVAIPLPTGVPGYGDALLRFAADAYSRHQAVYVLGEDLPQHGNRVTLDPVVRDSIGLPALRIIYRVHEQDVDQQRFLLSKAAELLVDSGARDVVTSPSRIPGGIFAGHAHGTTRMGSDPAETVADDSGLVHGTDNLFVAGAGLFVTAAGLNPALTIVALALRSVPTIAAAAEA